MFYKRGTFLYTTRHDTKTFVPSDKVNFISGVGFPDGKPSICGGLGPQCMITNLAYLDFNDSTKRMRVGSIHPGIDIEEIKSSTGFELIIPEGLKETKPPTIKEIKALREKADPLAIRKLEILAGSEREDLLNDIIEKELAMEMKFPKLIK
jgi:glutaconate CoA-transferase subunit B